MQKKKTTQNQFICSKTFETYISLKCKSAMNGLGQNIFTQLLIAISFLFLFLFFILFIFYLLMKI